MAQERDNAVLERAYSQERRQAGEELLVNMSCRDAAQDGRRGQKPTLVVERFIRISPGEICGARFATEQLENTYWKLTRLGDTPVVVTAQQREPHFILNTQSRRVGGSGGCNRLMGSYELSGDKLTFGQMAEP